MSRTGPGRNIGRHAQAKRGRPLSWAWQGAEVNAGLYWQRSTFDKQGNLVDAKLIPIRNAPTQNRKEPHAR